MTIRATLIVASLLGAVLVVTPQTTSNLDARGLLDELGQMLTKIPETKEECQLLLKQIATWQQRKLGELEKPQTKLIMATPHDKDEVSETPRVEGSVSAHSSNVWLIVHPMAVSDYWVQPKVSVRDDGSWSGIVHIGRPGKIDVGKQFEIKAVANPKENLNEGDVLSGWPKAELSSTVIEVTRK